MLVSSTIVVSQPNTSTVWTPGETYDISARDDGNDNVQGWQVDLVVMGAQCDDICIPDGIVSPVTMDYNTQSSLRFKVPTDLAHYGKGFIVQFSNAGSLPIYHSEKFTIERSSKGQGPPKADGSAEGAAHGADSSAPYVLPAALGTTFVSCIFAFFMI
ncbi:hypothetical protein BGZ51_005463 [Haplosporangium sp. Z 767]|nr:hypothetical protein BGZ51_005463 [Haplosporangium sp. Z 767]KAF9196386.1 hypothetical protein BGZ50_000387 [Haplosporangium sp. Z 11]